MLKNPMFALVAGLAFASPVLSQDETKKQDNPKVLLETTKGNITIELYADKAPITVKNFLRYVEDKHYDGTIFHRVIDGFMIQGGGMTASKIEKRTREPIANESSNKLSNTRGTIAMARTSDPNSATAQFFINVVNNDRLDKALAGDGFGYCVFGKVVDGMDVVDRIRKARTGARDVPTEDITIKSAKRLDQ